MQERYADWTKHNYPSQNSAKLQCATDTLKMVSAFPELTAVRGHVLVMGHYRAHWWCEDSSDGSIVDPTAHQWDIPPSFYEPHVGEEPHGKCINCGELLYRSRGADSHLCKTVQPTK